MSLDVAESIAAYLGYDVETAWRLCLCAPRSYRRFHIPKTKGGFRCIHHPSPQTKALQYALVALFLGRITVHDAAHGYVRGRSILSNAAAHASFGYSVRLDFKDFFPSIRPLDVLRQVKQCLGSLSNNDADFITNALFVNYGAGRLGLAVGAPSSPLASNIAMRDLDECLARLALSRGGQYSRYADDLIYSSNNKGECARFVTEVVSILKSTSSPVLRLNGQKTRFSSRGSKRIITGLTITSDGAVSVGKRNRRYIRKLLFDLTRGVLDEESAKYLRGYLAFIRNVDPVFYNRLALRYGGNTLDSAQRSKGLAAAALA